MPKLLRITMPIFILAAIYVGFILVAGAQTTQTQTGTFAPIQLQPTQVVPTTPFTPPASTRPAPSGPTIFPTTQPAPTAEPSQVIQPITQPTTALTPPPTAPTTRTSILGKVASLVSSPRVGVAVVNKTGNSYTNAYINFKDGTRLALGTVAAGARVTASVPRNKLNLISHLSHSGGTTPLGPRLKYSSAGLDSSSLILSLFYSGLMDRDLFNEYYNRFLSGEDPLVVLGAMVADGRISAEAKGVISKIADEARRSGANMSAWKKGTETPDPANALALAVNSMGASEYIGDALAVSKASTVDAKLVAIENLAGKILGSKTNFNINDRFVMASVIDAAGTLFGNKEILTCKDSVTGAPVNMSLNKCQESGLVFASPPPCMGQGIQVSKNLFFIKKSLAQQSGPEWAVSAKVLEDNAVQNTKPGGPNYIPKDPNFPLNAKLRNKNLTKNQKIIADFWEFESDTKDRVWVKYQYDCKDFALDFYKKIRDLIKKGDKRFRDVSFEKVSTWVHAFNDIVMADGEKLYFDTSAGGWFYDPAKLPFDAIGYTDDRGVRGVYEDAKAADLLVNQGNPWPFLGRTMAYLAQLIILPESTVSSSPLAPGEAMPNTTPTPQTQTGR